MHMEMTTNLLFLPYSISAFQSFLQLPSLRSSPPLGCHHGHTSKEKKTEMYKIHNSCYAHTSFPLALSCNWGKGTKLKHTGFVPFFRNNFQDFSRTQINFFKGSKIHINPYTPKISMLILLAFHTLHIFKLSSTDFQNFPGPVAFFQDFPVLENAIIKFLDFPGFPGPVRTLNIV